MPKSREERKGNQYSPDQLNQEFQERAMISGQFKPESGTISYHPPNFEKEFGKSHQQHLDPYFSHQQEMIGQSPQKHHPDMQRFMRTGGDKGGGGPKAPQREAFNVHPQTSPPRGLQSAMAYSQSHKELGRPSQMKQQQMPLEFVYEYDLDENGALFYLGSNGRTRQWQNPHAIGKVQAFASSVGSGRVEDFVGR